MRSRLLSPLLALALTTATVGCNRTQTTRSPGYAQGYGSAGYGTSGQYGAGQYGEQGQYPQYGGQGQYPQYGGQGQYPAPSGYPAQPAPTQQPQQPAPTQQPQIPGFGFPFPSGLPSGIPNPLDPINLVDIGQLRNRAGSVMGELIVALAPAPQAKVKDIPFMADATPGEVNAFAGCDDQGLPFMAITDGLLEIEAYVAQFKATDEVFGTRKLDAYLTMIAQNAKPKQPLPKPPMGFIDPMQSADPRKVARQGDLFDEQLAFVLGHELAHHHLGHTGCANGQGGSRGVNPADFGRLASRVVPFFNQPNEIASDIAGTNNLLAAGARRQGTKWSEEGALLTLDFFARLDQLTPATILFAFENSHPPPQLRRPIVVQAANAWRASGGSGWQLPSIPGLFGAR